MKSTLFWIVGLCILGLCNGSLVFADNGDCNIFLDNDKKLQTVDRVLKLKSISSYEVVLPLSDIKLAMRHLRSYCCVEVYNSKDLRESCENDPDVDSVFPESAYLYDHLIDVSVRRLDIQGGYGSEDDKAQKWKEYVDKEVTQGEGKKPLDILAKIKENWLLKTEDVKILETLKNIQDSPSYTTYNLATRYYAQCDLMYLLLQNIVTPKNPEKYKDGKKPQENIGYVGQCRNMMLSRINKEISLGKVLMADAGYRQNLTLMKSYLFDEFLQNRMNTLSTTLARIRELFVVFGKQAPLSAKCTQ